MVQPPELPGERPHLVQVTEVASEDRLDDSGTLGARRGEGPRGGEARHFF